MKILFLALALRLQLKIIIIANLKSLSQFPTPELFWKQSLLHCLFKKSVDHIFWFIHMYNNLLVLPEHFELFIVKNKFNWIPWGIWNIFFYQAGNSIKLTLQTHCFIMGSSINLCSIVWTLVICLTSAIHTVVHE